MQYARTVAFVGVLFFVTAVGMAENSPQLTPGSRVRVKVSAEQEQLVGKLLTLDDKNLSLRVEDEMEPRILPREQITGLAVSTGRRSRGRGALIGGGIGAAVGAAIGIATADESSGFGPSWSSGEGALVGAVLIGSIGALIGLAIPPGERWKDMPLNGVRLTLRPVPGRGAGVFLSVAF